MTTMPKRDRLTEAAKAKFCQQGVACTTLAEIAQQVQVPCKDEQEAKDLAIDLISSLQGTYVLTASFRSPELLERKLQRLARWIRSL